MTAPVIGMAVKFQPTIFSGDPAAPLLNASITAVNSATNVNLLITAGNGKQYSQAGVQFLQLADPLPGAIAPDGHIPFFARTLS